MAPPWRGRAGTHRGICQSVNPPHRKYSDREQGGNHMEKANVSKTATIEQLFEDYKARYYEETPRTEEQTAAMSELEELTNSAKGIAPAYDTAIALSRASEKAGFVLGFRMAMNLMRECMG